MSVLKTSWRCVLAATALWAISGPNPGAAADNRSTDLERSASADQSTAPQPATSREAKRDSGPASPDVAKQRQELYEQLKALHSKLEGLKEGQDSQRKELQAKAQKIYEQLRALPPPGGRGDLEQKIAHLRVAAENLRAAGLGDQADKINKMIEQLRAEQRDKSRAAQSGSARSGPGNYGRGPAPPSEEIQQLRNELRQMHREVQELREQVKRLAEQQRANQK
jgi:DNA repair exonuclease SbcCD ATPase subunit